MTQAKLMIYLIVTALLNCVNAKVTLNCNELISGYYWRDYTNEIPSDAIPGGTDNKENPTYIGQTLHPGASILPGYINVDKKKMFYEYSGSEHSSTEDVKILCSRQPEQFEWITTKSGEYIEDFGLIIGGHDKSRPLAIGRKAIPSGELVLGKVLITDKKFASLFLSNNGQGWSDNGPYEVLVYNSTFSEDVSTFSQDVSKPHQEKCSGKIINLNIY